MTQALVIGAGLAGLAAALDLAKAGVKVRLAERRAFPGGRAYSFADPSGETLDNGQHVFLECCTEYRSFLDDIGAGDLVTLQDRTEVPVVDVRSGETSWIRESWLPSPCHFLVSILKYKPLTPPDRRSVMRAGRKMQKDAGTDTESFGDWLRRHDQSPDCVNLFWNPFAIAILNEHVNNVSAAQGLFVFRTAFFAGKPAARIGIANVPLGDIAMRAVEKIRSLGGTVEFNSKIDKLPGGPVISAVPAKQLREIVDHPFLAPVEKMATSPIINLHFFFDRPIQGPRFFACVGGMLQWAFIKDRRVTLSQSAARVLMTTPNDQLEREHLKELKQVLPDARDAKVVRCIIIREPHATFVATPGQKSQRLPCQTPIPNLYLAGEWTESEWPSTMEAAVRSGRRAAKCVLSRLKPA